jgi:hypothetical protein
LLGGRPSALAVDALAAVFHGAGLGTNRIGISRLPVLSARIAAAAVDCERAHRRRALALGERRAVTCQRGGS